MALTLLKGQQACVLKLEDLKRFPGSLLATLASSVEAQGSNPTFRVDEVTESPLATWEEAFNITIALYRGDKKALLQSLHHGLASGKTVQNYSMFAALVDYLGISDPVQKLLPPIGSIPAGHMPVADLQYLALAKEALELMRGSTVYASMTWKAKAAFFFVSTKEVKGQLAGVSVYAVGGGDLHARSTALSAPDSWAPASPDNNTASGSVKAGVDLSATLLSMNGACGGSMQLHEVCRADCSNGKGIVKGVSQHHTCLGAHLASLLGCAGKLTANKDGGSAASTSVHTKCVTCSAEYYYSPRSSTKDSHCFYMWVMYW